MKRKDFIKTLAAACVAPVVAAKAIASPKEKSILDYKPTHAYSNRKLYDGNVYRHIMYDQSGNGNHAFLKDG